MFYEFTHLKFRVTSIVTKHIHTITVCMKCILKNTHMLQQCGTTMQKAYNLRTQPQSDKKINTLVQNKTRHHEVVIKGIIQFTEERYNARYIHRGDRG